MGNYGLISGSGSGFNLILHLLFMGLFFSSSKFCSVFYALEVCPFRCFDVQKGKFDLQVFLCFGSDD